MKHPLQKQEMPTWSRMPCVFSKAKSNFRTYCLNSRIHSKQSCGSLCSHKEGWQMSPPSKCFTLTQSLRLPQVWSLYFHKSLTCRIMKWHLHHSYEYLWKHNYMRLSMRVQGLGSNEIKQFYWLRAINWTHDFRLGSKTKKWQIKAKPKWDHFGREITWFKLKNGSLKESSWFGEPRWKLGSKVVIQLKDLICFNSVQIGS
jgi:hypothetical protein